MTDTPGELVSFAPCSLAAFVTAAWLNHCVFTTHGRASGWSAKYEERKRAASSSVRAPHGLLPCTVEPDLPMQ